MLEIVKEGVQLLISDFRKITLVVSILLSAANKVYAFSEKIQTFFSASSEFTYSIENAHMYHFSNEYELISDDNSYSWTFNRNTNRLHTTDGEFEILSSSSEESIMIFTVKGIVQFKGKQYYQGRFDMVFSNNESRVRYLYPDGASTVIESKELLNQSSVVKNARATAAKTFSESPVIKKIYDGFAGYVYKGDTLLFDFYAPEDAGVWTVDYFNRSLAYKQNGRFNDKQNCQILDVFEYEDFYELTVKGHSDIRVWSDEEKLVKSHAYEGIFTVIVSKKDSALVKIFPDGTYMIMLAKADIGD